MKSPVIKRSIVIDSRKTSISIEQIFWVGFKEIARDRGTNLSSLAASIKAGRADGSNLSSAIRVHVLSHFTAMAQALIHAGRTASPPIQLQQPDAVTSGTAVGRSAFGLRR
jgi:predicted DNA-binding ribbon-helix-helix protein